MKKLETSKVCITCERELEEKDLDVISKSIDKNKYEMKKIKENVKSLKEKYDSLDVDIKTYKEKLDKIVNKDYSFDEKLLISYKTYKSKKEEYKEVIECVQKTIDHIKENVYPNDLKEKLKPSYDNKTGINNKITDIELDKGTLSKKIESENEVLESLSLKIGIYPKKKKNTIRKKKKFY